MLLIYPTVIRHFLHHLMEQCSAIELRRSLTRMGCFLLLSFFTTIVINILLPSFLSKTSSSSSLSLLASSHIFFPSDLISLPYSQHELQTHFQGEELLDKKRTYIQHHSKQTNISSGKVYLIFKLFYEK
jgi:hypothetical protein